MSDRVIKKTFQIFLTQCKTERKRSLLSRVDGPSVFFRILVCVITPRN